MKNLYFMRHGLSEGNKAGVWSGRFNTPLSSEGHEQAKTAGNKAKLDGLVFDVIISSPLDRAHVTAQHVSKAVGYPVEKIILHPDFVERSFGELEGTGDQTAMEAYRRDEALIDTYKGVERLVDLQWRAQRALEYLHSLPHDNVLVVAHGAFGRALRRAIEKEPLHTRVKRIPNGELIKFI
jgi:broad specificity phosphatase PhoE